MCQIDEEGVVHQLAPLREEVVRQKKEIERLQDSVRQFCAHAHVLSSALGYSRTVSRRHKSSAELIVRDKAAGMASSVVILPPH